MMQAEPYRVEPPAPNDEAHRIARSLGLTVPACGCRRCAHLRDIALVSRSKFGDEDDRALEAIDRMNRRAGA